MSKSSTFLGVTRSVRCESRQWRAQRAAAGKNYHLGNFETEEEAARAYDNAVHYLGDFKFSQRGILNFPGEYKATPPAMTVATRRVILDCRQRQGAPDAQKSNKLFARHLPLLRQIAAVLPELEKALAGRPTLQSEATITHDGPHPVRSN